MNTGIEIRNYGRWFTATSTYMCWIRPTFVEVSHLQHEHVSLAPLHSTPPHLTPSLTHHGQTGLLSFCREGCKRLGDLSGPNPFLPNLVLRPCPVSDRCNRFMPRHVLSTTSRSSFGSGGRCHGRSCLPPVFLSPLCSSTWVVTLSLPNLSLIRARFAPHFLSTWTSRLLHLHPQSLALGILIGLCLLPILELLVCLRGFIWLRLDRQFRPPFSV